MVYLYYISRDPDQNGVSQLYNMLEITILVGNPRYHARDTPFWLGTLVMIIALIILFMTITIAVLVWLIEIGCHTTCTSLVGLLVKVSNMRTEDPGFNSCLGIFSELSYQWLKNWHSRATLPGAWHDRVSAETGQPGVSILWLGGEESLICNFFLSVAAHKLVWAGTSLRYTGMLLGCQANNNNTQHAEVLFCEIMIVVL